MSKGQGERKTENGEREWEVQNVELLTFETMESCPLTRDLVAGRPATLHTIFPGRQA